MLLEGTGAKVPHHPQPNRVVGVSALTQKSSTQYIGRGQEHSSSYWWWKAVLLDYKVLEVDEFIRRRP